MEGIVILIVIIILLVIFSSLSMGSKENEEKYKNLLSQQETDINQLEVDMRLNTNKLSKWVYSCKKCQNNEYYVINTYEDKLDIMCNRCNKTYEVKSKNAFYSVDCVEAIHRDLNKLNDLIYNNNLFEPLRQYFINHYNFKADIAPNYASGYSIYNFYFNKLKTKYISVDYKVSKKTFTINVHPFLSTKFISDGSMLDELEKKKNKVEMGKLNPNRPALSEALENEWNYKSITSGKKSSIIKKWAKTTSQKCPDGRKCGGILFSKLPLKDIAYGHIISQSFCKTFPHMYDNVHHPDNLYLTCKSCNSSLGGKNADDDLVTRVKNQSGTVGDWLRNYMNDIQETINKHT